MSNEVTFVAKRFPTFTTLVRPFCSVHTQVLKEAGGIAERFATLATLIRLLFRMNGEVLNEVGVLSK